MTSYRRRRAASLLVAVLLLGSSTGVRAGPPAVAVAAPASTSDATAATPEGWVEMSFAKPVGTVLTPIYDPGDKALPEILPPPNDTLRVVTDQAYLVGADAATAVVAAGTFAGTETRFNALTTEGPAGLQSVSRFLGLYRPGGQGAEAGDLYSEIWGFAEGVRWLADVAADGLSRPAVSLYVPVRQSANTRTVLTADDQFALGHFGLVGGEAATDGSWLVRGDVREQRFGLYLYDRQATGTGQGQGASGFVELPAKIDLQGGYTRSGAGVLALSTNDVALRVPLGWLGGLDLESAGSQTVRTHLRVQSLGFDGAAGPLFYRASYQRQNGEFLGVAGPPSPFGQRLLLASLSYIAASWLRLDLDGVDRQPDSTAAARWLQLTANARLSPSTFLAAVLTTSGSPFHDPVHLRLEQFLGHGLSVRAEYGRIPSFQGLDGALTEPRRLMLVVRKVWDVATPPGGGVVEGHVMDGGEAVGPGVPVELGRYRTATDDGGAYAFRNVPAGSYDLAVPSKGLPATDALAEPSPSVAVGRRSHTTVEVPLVPLCSVSGQVYIEHAAGSPAPRLSGVAMQLDERVTAVAADGSFSFANVPPGTHHLSVVADHLPAGLAVTIPSQIDLGLPPGARLDGLRFRLERKIRPLVVKELT